MSGAPVGADLGRMLGNAAAVTADAPAPPPPAAGRFRLTGVVATTTSRSPGVKSGPGVALISVDNGPVRAYRVGDRLDSQLSLWSVALRSVSVGDPSGQGTPAFVLELPPPTPPATGTLAQAVMPRNDAPAPPFSPPMPSSQAPTQNLPPPPAQSLPPISSLPAGPPPGTNDSLASQDAGLAQSYQIQGLPPGTVLTPGGAMPVKPSAERLRSMNQ